MPSSDAVPARPSRRRGSPLGGALVVLLVICTGLGGVVAAARTWQWASFTDGVSALAPPATPVPPPATQPGQAEPVSADPGSAGGDAPRDRPPPGLGASPFRLEVAPPAPIGGGSHAFLAVQDNGVTPVAYDPCRPVHYVLRPDAAPAGGEEIVHAAVARLAAATGLRFVHDGTTDEAVDADREPYQPERYGDRWAPVVVAWQTEAENAALAGDVVGEGGSVAVSLGEGPRVFVTGTVTLDADQFPGILARSDGPAVATAIVLHELGHLVGLGHVDDATQLMYPETRAGGTDLAAGDRTGLARLGRGVCAPDL